MSTYRFPEILIRLVRVQQDVLQVKKQTIKKFVNTPKLNQRSHLQVTCCLKHLSAERDKERLGEKRKSRVIMLTFFCKPSFKQTT